MTPYLSADHLASHSSLPGFTIISSICNFCIWVSSICGSSSIGGSSSICGSSISRFLYRQLCYISVPVPVLCLKHRCKSVPDCTVLCTVLLFTSGRSPISSICGSSVSRFLYQQLCYISVPVPVLCLKHRCKSVPDCTVLCTVLLFTPGCSPFYIRRPQEIVREF
jgi:hypothetical protein